MDIATQWLHARWDYAAIDLGGCVTGNTGYLGTWIASDAGLGTVGYLWGYPARAACPDGAEGPAGQPGPNGTIINTDCPGAGTWPGSTWRVSGSGPNGNQAPFFGAQLWGMNVNGSSHGTQQAANTILMRQDSTQGQSGAPLYFFLAANDRRVMGVLSWGGSDGNKGNRFTGETYDWLVSNTDFPDDR
jgi:hypothetical protein